MPIIHIKNHKYKKQEIIILVLDNEVHQIVIKKDSNINTIDTLKINNINNNNKDNKHHHQNKDIEKNKIKIHQCLELKHHNPSHI